MDVSAAESGAVSPAVAMEIPEEREREKLSLSAEALERERLSRSAGARLENVNVAGVDSKGRTPEA